MQKTRSNLILIIDIIIFEYLKKSLNLCTEMNQKEPVKITLTGILRWIFGLFFIKLALGMVIHNEYFLVVYMFMVVFVSFSPISNVLESN